MRIIISAIPIILSFACIFFGRNDYFSKVRPLESMALGAIGCTPMIIIVLFKI